MSGISVGASGDTAEDIWASGQSSEKEALCSTFAAGMGESCILSIAVIPANAGIHSHRIK
jgi:hypothetical protein